MIRVVGFVVAALAVAVMSLVAPPAAAAPPEKTFSIAGLASSYVRPEGKDKVPLAIIVAGSGATDRDANSVQGLRTDAYKHLAYALADLGIASVRYDKRGVGGSANLAPAEHELTLDLFAKDAAAMVQWGKQQPGVSSVVLVGHSEGGVVALLASKLAAPKAIVLLAVPGRPLGAILRDQLAKPALPEALRKEGMQIIAALERGEEVKTVQAELEPLFRPSVQPFLKSWIRLDPVELLRAVDVPTLVISGGRDIQIGRADFDALVAARGKIKGHWYPDMGHTLKLVTDELQTQGRAYTDPGMMLADGLAEWIAAFIHEAAGAPALKAGGK